MTKEIFEKVITDRMFEAPLRNVRALLNATSIYVDLIPEVISDSTFKPNRKELPEINSILDGTQEILEDSNFMRAHFTYIRAISIQDEYVNIIKSTKYTNENIPQLKSDKACYPFLVVKNSDWKSRLPDYDGGDDPDVAHYKIYSMETHVDILGILEKTEWHEQDSHFSLLNRLLKLFHRK